MDSYGGRGNGNKYQSGKGQSKTFRNNSGRSHDDEMRNDDYYGKKGNKKPDPGYYQQQQKSEKRFDRNLNRQGSEPRGQEPMKSGYTDRSRDTRSSEPGGNHYKPPSGQPRISNAALQRLPPNIDSLPPRLKKKYLQDAGLSEDLMDKPIMEMMQQSYSNTLPTGRGGRNNNRYDYHNSYRNQNYHNDYEHRSLTPPLSKASSRLVQHQQQQTPPKPPHQPQPQRFEWKSERRDEEVKNDDGNFDWSEDVMNSQSLPHDVNVNVAGQKYEEGGSRRNRRRRNRSTSSNGSVDRSGSTFNDNFKMPFPKPPNNNNINNNNNNRQRRNSQSSFNSRENSMERGFAYNSRENSLDRRQPRRSRYNGRRGSDYQSSRENSSERFSWSRNNSLNNLRDDDGSKSWRNVEEGSSRKIAELTNEFKNSVDLKDQRTLFDPRNPGKPIVVPQRPRDFTSVPETYSDQQYLSAAKPQWVKKNTEQYRNCKLKHLLDDLSRLDDELMAIVDRGELLRRWDECLGIRKRIEGIFEQLLTDDMRFCQSEHVEHHFWKLLFYRVIEVLRKQIQESDEASKASFKEKALETVDYGTRYLESVLKLLENRYSFKMEEYIGENAAMFRSGLGYVGLALVSAQKIFLFLGDLARYREQINQTNNFGRAKNFYVKAQQVVPKNGRPFNQLALLAVYSKRKIDAVYFYMRSLMSSNPFEPAKESLVALFDEIRKKYEFSQKKREEKSRLRLKEKEHRFDGNLRKETWIHPEDGCRVHRTAPLDPAAAGKSGDSSDDEELRQMDPSELNKRFVISFLHVQGKLITRIGMESFQTCATLMLKEFRALLQISPITINSHRLLQLISLNMYAIACTELKDQAANSQIRSEVQECAISLGLLMFGIILERFIEVLRESLLVVSTAADNGSKDGHEPKKSLTLNEDARIMLPAIKAWCDWMMFSVSVWNPPPFCSDYKIGAASNHDPWNGLATLMTLLETVVDSNKDYLSLEGGKDFRLVRLQEDVTLAGFTPLKKNTMEPIFCRCDIDIEIAQNALRLQKLRYFGTSFLCKCDQPILKKVTTSSGKIEFTSVVQNRTESASDSEILLESFSDEEDSKDTKKESNGNAEPDLKSHHDAAEIRKLLRRKDELERKQRMTEKYKERLQDILSQSTVALHIEVRPRFLIPDTNCFVDDLISIKAIAEAHPLYQLMVPITVINELEGLSRGIKPLTSTGIVVTPQPSTPTNSTRSRNRNDPQHAAFVAKASKEALVFLKSKNPATKCVTAKGSIINSAMFTSEDVPNEQKSNDDIILDTALNLCKKNVEEKRGEVRHLVREVVLLTTDRNLRVKALTNDLPVRELPDFVKWAGLA